MKSEIYHLKNQRILYILSNQNSKYKNSGNSLFRPKYSLITFGKMHLILFLKVFEKHLILVNHSKTLNMIIIFINMRI